MISNYSNTGLTKIEEISEHLKKYDVKAQLVREKITINAIWSQFIYEKYSKNIKIDVEKLKQDIRMSENQTEYLLSEIVFDLKEKQTLNDKLNVIENAIQKNGFENTALIYSISETANSSGYIGWVNENSMNKKILDEVTKISINGITKPLVIPGGYLILKLKEKELKKDIDIENELKKLFKLKPTNN